MTLEQGLNARVDSAVANLSKLHSSALQSAQPQVVVTDRPKRKMAKTRRVADGFETEIIEVPHEAPAGVQ